MSQQTVVAFVCSEGCCQGCRWCYGMRIGCHARPCRCRLPCSCDLRSDEPDWLCRRHQFRATDGVISGRRVRERESKVFSARFDRALIGRVASDELSAALERPYGPESS